MLLTDSKVCGTVLFASNESVHVRGCPKPLANFRLGMDNSWLFCSVADNLQSRTTGTIGNANGDLEGLRWPASSWFCTAFLSFLC